MEIKKTRFEERLAKYPHLKARFEAMLDIAENTAGLLDRADDAEAQLIEETRKMGNEMLTQWANNQESRKAHEAKLNKPQLKHHTKKNFTGTQHSEQ